MNENKNIDRLFQEKFKDFEVFPESHVWRNIEKQITKKKKRRIVPLWLRFGGAAAIVLFLISSGFWFFNTGSVSKGTPDEIIITNSDKSNIKLNRNNSAEINENESISSSIQKEKEKSATSELTKNRESITTDKNESAGSFTTRNEKSVIAEGKKVENELFITSKLAQEFEVKNDQKALNQIAFEEFFDRQKKVNNDILTEIEKDESKVKVGIQGSKWSIGSTMAPVYYNTLRSGSPIDPELANNNKSSNGNISYGLKLNYKITDNLILQTGINSLELGYTTNNVASLLSSSLLEGSSTNIDTNVEGASVSVISTARQSSDGTIQRPSFDPSGTLDQTLGYVEMPMELKYIILQKRVGVNVVGGVSTYFLYRNYVSMSSFGKTTTLGEASNINMLNFSGNLGLDLDYSISKKLFINISPMFKYQFNTFSEYSGGFQPYYFGVYSGLNFRF